jgi:tRNA-splicing endonuclease subunit Sen2
VPESMPEPPVTPTDEEAGDLVDEAPLEDVEHLQLTLQEAFFLLWNLNCLSVLDPQTVCSVHSLRETIPTPSKQKTMSLHNIWITFQKAHLPPVPSQPLQFDNPFLVNYVVYHHYRSLGWVVKGGIKFCVDYLLYKRGPVFTHAEYVPSFIVTILQTHTHPLDSH